MSIVDIWWRITSVGFDCGAGAECCGGKKILLVRDRHMFQIFCQGPCQVGIFDSELASVENVNTLNQSPGKKIPCKYVGIW